MPKDKTQETHRFRPLGDRVLVRVDAAEAVTPGGIHLPDKAQEKPHRGTVLAVGPGKFVPEMYAYDMDLLNKHGWSTEAKPPETIGFQKPAVKPGDTVLFNQWAGVEVPKELGENLRVMGLDDLLGVEE